MKKRISKILTCGMCLSLAAIFTACTPNTLASSGEDPETRPFVVAIGATDEVFSPFFATAQYDTQVTELTQISMLNADAKGKIVYGENEPTVVLDYTQKMYDKNGVETKVGDMQGTTVYEFVIKNGIKFSDGVDLTIKDVLFNLYVYLDPVYFGSSTIYSTDIVGLAEYRTQLPGANANTDISATFNSKANSRILDITDYLDDNDSVSSSKVDQILEDIETLKDLFKKELLSDWSSIYGTLESYEEEYRFTTNWEIFYFTEGVVGILYDENGANWTEKKDENGKYLTDLDEGRESLRTDMEAVLSNEELIADAMAEYECDRAQALEYLERDTAVDTVYKMKTESGDEGILSLFEEGWASVETLHDQFVRAAMTEYYEEIKEQHGGKLLYENVEGIQVKTPATSNTFQGKYAGHDILQITINGVDPKAIWNFAFQVAPAHYYSGEFDNGKGMKDYREINIADNQFGVCFGNDKFFNNILNSTAKSKCPVGAGAYQTANADGNPTRDGSLFHPANKTSYYMRNEYFETVGAGIQNAKIKYFRYREVKEDNLIQALKTGDVDYGEPNCTTKNIQALSGTGLGYKTPMSASYGYVGINPKYIPDIEVRRAIIKSMRIMNAVDYYGERYAEAIYRPMSKANWVYEDYLKGVGAYYQPASASAIWDELYAAGWRKNGQGIGVKSGRTLKYTFTIAGGSSEHPAYNMFLNAAALLRQAGFDITVKTSGEALQKLATGSLEVWAAAYTSPIDPDLYQLYHKDSKATNVKNWGYESILNDKTTLYSTEREILNRLSTHIVEARQDISESVRGPKYVQALNEIMELAIQLPVYQRKDLVVYNSGLLANLNRNPGAYAGVLNRVWEVTYT